MVIAKTSFRPSPLVIGTVLFALSATGPVAAETAKVAPNTAQTDVASSAPGADLTGYRLGSGDRVRLIVFGEPNLTGEFAVDGSGYIGVPLIGKVRAEDTTAQELETKIAGKLSPDYLKNPSVNIEISRYRPFYIVGEVRQPGSYPYVAGMTVINAVALSGGFTYRASEDEFEIERRQNKQVQKIVAKPRTTVLPGDVIVVDERFF